MRKTIKYATFIFLLTYIPIVVYGVYIINYKVYDSQYMFAGLESLGDHIFVIILLTINTLLIMLCILFKSYFVYNENKGMGTKIEKKAKVKIRVIIIIFICVFALVMYYPIKNFVADYDYVYLEPTFEEVSALAEEEVYLSILIYEEQYSVETIALREVDEEVGIYYYDAIVVENAESIIVSVKKYYTVKTLTKKKSDVRLILMGISDSEGR